MIKFFADHLGGLFRFSGREALLPFWLWTAFTIALETIAMAALMVPMMVETFAKVERFAAEHPDQVTRTVGPGSYSVQIHGNHPELMPDFSSLFSWLWIGIPIAVLLSAAAVVRRLHDCDRSGFWGLLPLPFLAAGMFLMPQMFAQLTSEGEPDLGLFFGVFINNMAYLAMLALLAFRCAQPGSPGENRYGPPPA